MSTSPEVSDEEFLRSISLSVEEIRRRYPQRAAWMCASSSRWFESPNVIDLWSRLSEERQAEICKRLRWMERRL